MSLRLLRYTTAAALIFSACGGTDHSGAPEPADEGLQVTSLPSATEAPSTTTTEVPPMLGNPLPLTNLDGWLQTDIGSLDDLRGQVEIVQFWTFGCINCKRTLPYLQDIYAEYKDSGWGSSGCTLLSSHTKRTLKPS